MNPKHQLYSDATRAIEDELLEATVLSKYPKFNIAQIAREYSVPSDVVEAIAQKVAHDSLGLDLESLEFQSTVAQIAKIEEAITDEGLKAWKIQSLARKCKRSYRELMDCYNKALCNQAPVQPLSPREFRAKNSRETEWIIPGWIPQGTCLLLHGDGGTGKTLMAYQWLQAILTGQTWNQYPVKQGTCLLVQCDEPEIVLRSRLDLFQISDDAPLAILTDWDVNAISRLKSYLEEFRPQLIVIDSLSAVNSSCIFNENDTEYARPVLQLTKLCSEFNCTILLIHHSNQMGQARGTRAIHNSVSEVWSLKAGECQSERILSVQKTRLGRAPGSYKFRFDEDTFQFDYQGDAVDGEGLSVTTEEKIRLWLYQDANREIPYTSTEISEYCGISQGATRRALFELWAKGVLSRRPSTVDKRGFVYLSPQPLDDISMRSRDQCIEKRSHPPDRISNPVTEPGTESCDHAITLSAKFSAKKGDRMIANSQTVEPERSGDAITDAITMRSLAIADLNSVTSLNKGDLIEIDLTGWKEAKFVAKGKSKLFGRTTDKRIPTIDVEYKGQVLTLPIDAARLPSV